MLITTDLVSKSILFKKLQELKYLPEALEAGFML